jgi:hypothetical protein
MKGNVAGVFLQMWIGLFKDDGKASPQAHMLGGKAIPQGAGPTCRGVAAATVPPGSTLVIEKFPRI